MKIKLGRSSNGELHAYYKAKGGGGFLAIADNETELEKRVKKIKDVYSTVKFLIDSIPLSCFEQSVLSDTFKRQLKLKPTLPNRK